MTWTIGESKRVDSKNPIIVDNYKDLLFYDGPVLFLGINHEGAPVAGSLAEYPNTPQRNVIACIHCVPNGADYINYRNRLIDYPTMLANARELYRVDSIWDGLVRTEKVYLIAWDDVPEDYRPRAGSMCPPEGEWGNPYDDEPGEPKAN